MTAIVGHTTRAAGTILTHTIYNTDHVTHITNASALNADKVESTIAINTAGGSGLTGGGNLTASRSLAVSFATAAEAAVGTATDRLLSVALATSLRLGDKTAFTTTGVDAVVLGETGGLFLVTAINGATGGAFNLEVSSDGGTTYTTLRSVANSSNETGMLVAVKGTKVRALSWSTVYTATLTAGAGNVFFRRGAGGSGQTTDFTRIL